jgi:hypothetical protein
MDETDDAVEASGDTARRRTSSKKSPGRVKKERPRSIEPETRPEKYAMGKSSTVRVERPPVSSESTYTAIPFGPKIRTQRAAVVKVLAAVTRSSWVDPDTRRRITMASNRHLAALAAVADPQTIAKHLATLAEVGAVTIEHTGDHRVVVVHERAEGIGDQFVVLTDSHPAWSFRPRPFSLFLAVRSFDFQNTGRCWPKNVSLAKFLNWSERAVKRTMAELRGAGAVTTVSVFNPSSVTRKRMIYAPNPTPNPEPTMPGGYEKVDPLCDDARVRKSGPHPYEKVDPTPTKKWTPPLRKSGPLKTNSEDEFLRTTASTNQPREKFTGQSESEPGAELAEVVVVDELASTDTNPETKPQPAGPPAPGTIAEVIALLAKSQLERDEQERYLEIAKRLAETDNPPPTAWHRHVLDVKPSTGMISLAGIIIARLKKWTTTPAEQRAAIVDEIEAKDAEVIAKRLRSAKFWYEAKLGSLKADRNQITPAEVRRSWSEYNAALVAAGQPAVMLPNEVLHAEETQRKRDELAAESAKAEVKRSNEKTLQDCESRIEKVKRQLGLYGMGDITCESEKFERTYDAIRSVSLDMDPTEYRSALKGTFIEAFPFWEALDEREKAEIQRVLAEQRRLERIESKRVEIEREKAEEVNRRIREWSQNRQIELTKEGFDAATVFQRIRNEWSVEAERIKPEVDAEFAPKFAAMAPTSPPAIRAMVSR